MDGKTWAKFARDCGIVNHFCSISDVDLIFAEVKDGPSYRKINYDEFWKGVLLCAGKRGESFEELEQIVLAAGKPRTTGTTPQATRLHDDQAAHTGVHAHRFSQSSSAPTSTARPSSGRERLRAESWKNLKAPSSPVGQSSTGQLQDVFYNFTGGAEQMDGRMFAKFARDCGLVTLSADCTSGDVDLIFAKVVGKVSTALPSRKIGYQQFLDAIFHISRKRGEEMTVTERIILAAGGPLSSGTVAAEQRLHDDPSQYTGAQAARLLSPSRPASARPARLSRPASTPGPLRTPSRDRSSEPPPSPPQHDPSLQASPHPSPSPSSPAPSATSPSRLAAPRLSSTPPPEAHALPPPQLLRAGVATREASGRTLLPSPPEPQPAPAAPARSSPFLVRAQATVTGLDDVAWDAAAQQSFCAAVVATVPSLVATDVAVTATAAIAVAPLGGGAGEEMVQGVMLELELGAGSEEAAAHCGAALVTAAQTGLLATQLHSAGLPPALFVGANLASGPEPRPPLAANSPLSPQPPPPRPSASPRPSQSPSGLRRRVALHRSPSPEREEPPSPAAPLSMTAPAFRPPTARSDATRDSLASARGRVAANFRAAIDLLRASSGAKSLSPERDPASEGPPAQPVEKDVTGKPRLTLGLRTPSGALVGGGSYEMLDSSLQALVATPPAAFARSAKSLTPERPRAESKWSTARAALRSGELKGLGGAGARGGSRGGALLRAASMRRRKSPEEAVAWAEKGKLKDVFYEYAAGEEAMDSFRFFKFARDCNLINARCTMDDVDATFHTVRRDDGLAGYRDFVDAVCYLAEMRRQSMAELERVIRGPKFSGFIAHRHHLPGEGPGRGGAARSGGAADAASPLQARGINLSIGASADASLSSSGRFGKARQAMLAGRSASARTLTASSAASDAQPRASLERTRSEEPPHGVAPNAAAGRDVAGTPRGRGRAGVRLWSSMKNLRVGTDADADAAASSAGANAPPQSQQQPPSPPDSPAGHGAGLGRRLTLQVAEDAGFAAYHERLRALRAKFEMARKARLVSAQAAAWVLMPGESVPDEKRYHFEKGPLPPLSLVEEAVRQVKRVFRWTFDNVGEAFTFFDVGKHLKISLPYFHRGFYRMNLHELWRCPHPECARFMCALHDDAEEHTYLLMDERMCFSIMRLANVVDNTFHRQEFEKFFAFQPDEAKETLAPCVDVVSTSATTKGMRKRMLARAESGGKMAMAQVQWQGVIDRGRDSGFREDWMRYARWLGGGNAWRLLHRQLAKLQEQYERRKAMFEATCSLIRNMNDGDRDKNKALIAKGERKMEKATKVIQQREERVLATIEKFALHLILPKALEEFNGRKVVPLAPNLSNLMAVFQDLMDALISLSPDDRTALLLWKETPEGEMDGLSLMDTLDASALSSLDLSGLSEAESSRGPTSRTSLGHSARSSERDDASQHSAAEELEQEQESLLQLSHDEMLAIALGNAVAPRQGSNPDCYSDDGDAEQSSVASRSDAKSDDGEELDDADILAGLAEAQHI